MSSSYLITRYMTAYLPTVSEQKKLPFRPEPREVDALYRAINRHVFDNELTQPKVQLCSNMQKTWGLCYWADNRQSRASWGKMGTWCEIHLSDKWFCPQWFCITLAHEMVHQYQWDIERFVKNGWHIRGDSGGHGPSFYAWKDRLAYHGIPLKISHGMKRWFLHQDFRKC